MLCAYGQAGATCALLGGALLSFGAPVLEGGVPALWEQPLPMEARRSAAWPVQNWELPPQLEILDLSDNTLEGPYPIGLKLPDSLYILALNRNTLSGGSAGPPCWNTQDPLLLGSKRLKPGKARESHSALPASPQALLCRAAPLHMVTCCRLAAVGHDAPAPAAHV